MQYTSPQDPSTRYLNVYDILMMTNARDISHIFFFYKNKLFCHPQHLTSQCSCHGCNAVGQLWDCESVTTGGGWPQLSTCWYLAAPILLFNSWIPVFPWGQYPQYPGSLTHRWEGKKKKKSYGKWERGDHVWPVGCYSENSESRQGLWWNQVLLLIQACWAWVGPHYCVWVSLFSLFSSHFD